MRVRARKDANHIDIVGTFRQCGASVVDTAQLGGGMSDLVIGYKGTNVLVEVKDGTKPPSARKLTPDEQEFQATWRGMYVIVESVDDVIKLLKELS